MCAVFRFQTLYLFQLYKTEYRKKNLQVKVSFKVKPFIFLTCIFFDVRELSFLIIKKHGIYYG